MQKKDNKTRALYESIMREVAQTVKCRLNEADEEKVMLPPKPWMLEVEMIGATSDNSTKRKFYVQMDECPIVSGTKKLTDAAIDYVFRHFSKVLGFDSKKRIAYNNGGYWRWRIIAEGDNAFKMNMLLKKRAEIDKQLRELQNQ